MQQHGEYEIVAPSAAVWAALHDRAVLERCIPGCERLDQASATEFAAKLRAEAAAGSKIEPTSLVLRDLAAPNSLQLTAVVDSTGAAASEVAVRLELFEDAASRTRLRCAPEANSGGEGAETESAALRDAALGLADAFCARLGAEFDDRGSAVAQGAGDGAQEIDYQPSNQWWIWVVMFGVLLTALLLAF
ncbi:MAG: SRPBCC domain-containing protein [Pseudomonadota bacterium]